MYEVILIPLKDCDNEYSTPCFFYFDTYKEVTTFMKIVFTNGVDLQATITNVDGSDE